MVLVKPKFLMVLFINNIIAFCDTRKSFLRNRYIGQPVISIYHNNNILSFNYIISQVLNIDYQAIIVS
jgi:hypothetical protein